jgi:hypothetical protein
MEHKVKGILITGKRQKMMWYLLTTHSLHKVSQFIDKNIQCDLFITLFPLLMNIVLNPA